MNWRKILLSLAVAAGLILTFVPRASADPWFWHQRHERYERYHEGDRFGWFRHWSHDRNDSRRDHDRDDYAHYRYRHDRD
jgi:hypothetical protein